MSLARSSLLQVVNGDLKTISNPDGITKEFLVSSTRRAINNNGVYRLFDILPRVVDQGTIKDLGERYLTLLRNARFSNEEPFNVNVFTEQEIKKWTNEVIEMAISELLNDSGEVRSEIVNYFGWGDLRDRLDVMGLVSSYVGAVCAQIHHSYANDIREKYTEANQYSYLYLNKNRHDWQKKVMREYGLLVSTTEAVAVAASVIGGAGIAIGALVAFGVFAVRYVSGGDAPDLTKRL